MYFTCAPPWQTLLITIFDTVMLLELLFGRKRFDGSDTHRVQPKIVLVVAYFQHLGAFSFGPITVKTSDDTLKIRHTAATIKFNELWINYYVLTIFRKSRQKRALHVLKHQSVTNRIRVYFKVFHSFTSYKSTQDQSVSIQRRGF